MVKTIFSRYHIYLLGSLSWKSLESLGTKVIWENERKGYIDGLKQMGAIFSSQIKRKKCVWVDVYKKEQISVKDIYSIFFFDDLDERHLGSKKHGIGIFIPYSSLMILMTKIVGSKKHGIVISLCN